MDDNKQRGKDDPKLWSIGGVGDLRDSSGGTYGEITPTDTPEGTLIQPRKSHPNAQPGADVRSESVVISNELPEGLKRARNGPINKTTGRRPAKA